MQYAETWKHCFCSVFGAAVSLLVLCPNWSCAVTSQQVLVVVNNKMAGSRELAHYYQKMRKIPGRNVLEFALPVTENISRGDYNRFQEKLAESIEMINQYDVQSGVISYVVLIYGVPLRVIPDELDLKDQEKLHLIEKQLAECRADDSEMVAAKKNLIQSLENQLTRLQRKDDIASVDSELSLSHYPGHSLSGWLRNPRVIERETQSDAALSGEPPNDKILTVARLDGPDLETVYRMIGDTFYTEETGLKGMAYFDARWPELRDAKARTAFAQYDLSIHAAAAVVKEKMVTVLNSEPSLFAEKACPDAALYCGWYSVGQYTDSFAWVQGSIGYHIASSECVSLRQSPNNQWCASMLKNGAAAVIGPVSEPYVQGFPLPELFFNELVHYGRSLGIVI